MIILMQLLLYYIVVWLIKYEWTDILGEPLMVLDFFLKILLKTQDYKL